MRAVTPDDGFEKVQAFLIKLTTLMGQGAFKPMVRGDS